MPQGIGYRKHTMAHVRGELARILRFAERRGKVMCNVATLVDVPAGLKKRGRSLAVVQAKVVLDAAVGDRLEALCVTDLLMGLRPESRSRCRGPASTGRPSDSRLSVVEARAQQARHRRAPCSAVPLLNTTSVSDKRDRHRLFREVMQPQTCHAAW